MMPAPPSMSAAGRAGSPGRTWRFHSISDFTSSAPAGETSRRRARRCWRLPSAFRSADASRHNCTPCNRSVHRAVGSPIRDPGSRPPPARNTRFQDGVKVAAQGPMHHIVRTSGLAAVAVALTALFAVATPGGTLPGPLPLFPSDNWWNLDISTAPVDSASASYISFISNGTVRRMHPDFGGDVSPGSVQIYGFPYVVV